ncbi:putative calmodulin-binding heat shock protein [Arabidopsis thaliana]|uniref:F6N23.21 protein n=1 Tax=Arabidopsis thaliana TaxID=3702 RepID=O65259_ARATH|nr:F6N23.21 gene product [Arabidopsis thaliana]CAB80859.1 putative calmodulin-binding heat shock protein [Arabidopsis thaliana]
MSILCCVPVLECVYCLGCTHWLWKKCLYSAGHESENWGLATSDEFEPIPRICRLILAVYEENLHDPMWAPPDGYGIDPNHVILKKDYDQTEGRVTPYMIYLDHENGDVVLAIRGLNLAKECDYAVLLDNKLGQTKFDGGYVHNGLLKAAMWVFEEEHVVLRELLEANPSYSLTFVGHSLGAGVVSLLVLFVIQNRVRLGNIERKRIRCFAIAPPRCMSLHLAVTYADVINSVVLQDDFLPRTTTALENVFKSIICLPCLLCLTCLKDTFTFEERKLKDARRLYAPGRLYHIVVRKPLRLGRYPPVVRTAVPVDGRFEQIVLSCNATADHAIIWIERESQRALDKIVRQKSIVEDHDEEYRAAIMKAASLNIPMSPSPSYGTFHDTEEGESSAGSGMEGSPSGWSFKGMRRKWDQFIDCHFPVNDNSEHMIFKNQESQALLCGQET